MGSCWKGGTEGGLVCASLGTGEGEVAITRCSLGTPFSTLPPTCSTGTTSGVVTEVFDDMDGVGETLRGGGVGETLRGGGVGETLRGGGVGERVGGGGGEEKLGGGGGEEKLGGGGGVEKLGGGGGEEKLGGGGGEEKLGTGGAGGGDCTL